MIGFDRNSCNSTKYGISSVATNEYAFPDSPARAHLPTLWINNFDLAGKLKFITFSSNGISIPLEEIKNDFE